jgi:hypothetical protein
VSSGRDVPAAGSGWAETGKKRENGQVNRLDRILVILALLLPALFAGCKTNMYIVPLPIIKDYEAPLPINVGFFMTRDLRDQWWDNQPATPRIDVPIGKVVLDFARANFKNAFRHPATPETPEGVGETVRDFYDIRYADRRSNRGLLVKLNSIDYDVKGKTAYCTLSVTLEDAAGREVFSKSYSAQGTPEEGTGLLQRTLYGENSIELSTAAALTTIYQQMLADIASLLAEQG